MSTMRQVDAIGIEFAVHDADAAAFEVIRYAGTEGLCRLYRFEVELATATPLEDLSAIVGRRGRLSIRTPRGQRQLHGVIVRLEAIGETVGQFYYRAELMPCVAQLTQRYASRIFQDRSTPEIVADVLQRAGITSDRLRVALAGTYAKREYCVQYRETDHNFISRLLEREGIWWYFEQTDSGEVLVLADSPAAHAAIDGGASLPYHPPTGMNAPDEHVFRFCLGETTRPNHVVLRDFNFQKPQLPLESAANAEGRDDGTLSDYPGGFGTLADGVRVAQCRNEEIEAGRVAGAGASSSMRLSPGRIFDLVEHPNGALNDAYLITSVTHEGKQATTRSFAGASDGASVLGQALHQSLLASRSKSENGVGDLADALLALASRLRGETPGAPNIVASWVRHGGEAVREALALGLARGADATPLDSGLDRAGGGSANTDFDAPVYACRFECIPAERTYRPQRVTPWPIVRGTQTARVVGPPDEEIHTDAFGRVKVQFHWDREGQFNDASSCWIRVSQGMAGGGYGIMFLPRIGQEVVVGFLEGDPDQPLIVGRVYNADHMPPYELPAKKTVSCIKTNSSRGGGGTNEIRFEDAKDAEQMLLYAQKDLHVRVKHDQVETIDNERHLVVAKDSFELVKQARHSEITLDLNEKVGGNRSSKVAGDMAEEFDANHSEKVGSNYYLKSGSNVVIEAGAELTLKAGGNFIKIDASGVTIMGTMVKINSGGAAGIGSLVAAAAPAAARVADEAVPGRDMRYQQAPAEPQEPTTLERVQTSWIEIELVNEAGQPVAGEAYEIIARDGEQVHTGTLDSRGQAHVRPEQPGECQVCFPRLDAAAWS